MRAKILLSLIFALLAGCWIASGQTFIGLPFRPLSSGGVPGPESISTIRYYWVASDLAADTQIEYWADRKFGMRLLTNGPSANAPTNYATGVYFNGTSHKLSFQTNFNWTPTHPTGAGYSFWAIIKPETPGSDFAGLVDSGTVGVNGGGFGLNVRTSNNLLQNTGGGSGNFASFTSGQLFDFHVSFTNSAASSGFTNAFWTNSIFITSNNWGMAGIGTPIHLGVYSNLSRYYKGYIVELAWFSNALSQAEITLLHTYATNTYSFTP
jgi:hypothetical protein